MDNFEEKTKAYLDDQIAYWQSEVSKGKDVAVWVVKALVLTRNHLFPDETA